MCPQSCFFQTFSLTWKRTRGRCGELRAFHTARAGMKGWLNTAAKSFQANIQCWAESGMPTFSLLSNGHLFSALLFQQLLTAVSKSGGIRTPPLTRLHQEEVVSIPQLKTSEESLKEILPQYNQLTLAGNWDTWDTQPLACTAAPVFSWSRLFLSPKASPKTFAGLQRSPLVFKPLFSTGELQTFWSYSIKRKRCKMNCTP